MRREGASVRLYIQEVADAIQTHPFWATPRHATAPGAGGKLTALHSGAMPPPREPEASSRLYMQGFVEASFLLFNETKGCPGELAPGSGSFSYNALFFSF